jgi:glyoxylase-like metal-dependent hydrolase (beta-lactamase superfamily II)
VTQQIQVATIVSAPFEENAYIAQIKGATDCLVIDPGLDPEKIIAHLDDNGLVPSAVLNTHGHSDHIGGNAALKRRWPDCPLVIGVADAEKLTDPAKNLSAAFGAGLVSPPADVVLKDNDTYSAAGLDLLVRAIPGHTAGHVVFIWGDPVPKLVFVGDVIFAGSIGRTDFPDGDYDQLSNGIRDVLFALPDETALLPGHGPPTTVGRERRDNPFVGARAIG